VLAAVSVVAAAGLVQSAARQPVWKDNTTLFAQTIRDAPRSYWAWRNWGGDLVLQGRLDSAKVAYHHSLELYDRDPTVYDDLAGINRRQGHCDVAIPLLHKALEIDSTRYQTVARLIGCLVTVHDYADARAEARRAIADGQKAFQSLLALVDSAAAPGHQ
ncbi:MAG TPA: tetratricopeptide repeat protein, partial [Gemmatimonadales bacterium]|nr:tetratricopeptide repeat protein [Gemmatimonadales bacterium]